MIIDVNSLLLLLLPIIIAILWYFGSKQHRKMRRSRKLPSYYLTSLNYFLEEQDDKAVDSFITALQADRDTVETHLALGSMYRRHGEVSRAIKIHQNLVTEKDLDERFKTLALLELAKDYHKAGVLDRAENFFIEVLERGDYTLAALRHLIDIYEQEKNWHSAIKVSKELGLATGQNQYQMVAHYHCELAQQHVVEKNMAGAETQLKQALSADVNCVRASIIEAELAVQAKNYRKAINAYQRVYAQDKEFFSEVIENLAMCYKAVDATDDFIYYLSRCLNKQSDVSIALYLAKYKYDKQDAAVAINFLYEQLTRFNSLKGILALIELKQNKSHEFKQIHQLIEQMLDANANYQCQQCGFSSKKLYWHCPGCKSWNKIKPIQEETTSN